MRIEVLTCESAGRPSWTLVQWTSLSTAEIGVATADEWMELCEMERLAYATRRVSGGTFSRREPPQEEEPEPILMVQLSLLFFRGAIRAAALGVLWATSMMERTRLNPSAPPEMCRSNERCFAALFDAARRWKSKQ